MTYLSGTYEFDRGVLAVISTLLFCVFLILLYRAMVRSEDESDKPVYLFFLYLPFLYAVNFIEALDFCLSFFNLYITPQYEFFKDAALFFPIVLIFSVEAFLHEKYWLPLKIGIICFSLLFYVMYILYDTQFLSSSYPWFGITVMKVFNGIGYVAAFLAIIIPVIAIIAIVKSWAMESGSNLCVYLIVMIALIIGMLILENNKSRYGLMVLSKLIPIIVTIIAIIIIIIKNRNN